MVASGHSRTRTRLAADREPSGVGIACFVGAAIMLGTATFSFCPIYRLLGLSTTQNS